MPQVSRKKLDKSIHKKIFQQFSRLNSNLNKKKSSVFLSTLLTETEQTMLAKRLACVLMLHEGYSQYVVEKTLGLSSSTVARVSVAVDFGRYDSLIKIVDQKREERKQFWNTLEILLRAGMPSMGKERWKHLPEV